LLCNPAVLNPGQDSEEALCVEPPALEDARGLPESWELPELTLRVKLSGDLALLRHDGGRDVPLAAGSCLSQAWQAWEIEFTAMSPTTAPLVSLSELCKLSGLHMLPSIEYSLLVHMDAGTPSASLLLQADAGILSKSLLLQRDAGMHLTLGKWMHESSRKSFSL